MSKAPAPIPGLTTEELRRFVDARASGHVLVAQDVPEDLVGKVFVPLMFGFPYDPADVGTVYAYDTDRSMGGMSINGYRMHSECRVMNKRDWARCVDLVNAEIDARAARMQAIEGDGR